jgi:hypothetical protein
MAIKGYAMAKPSLQPHQIRATIMQTHKWAQEGLDIENAFLLAVTNGTFIKQPFAAKVTDAKGNPIYGQAVAERRNRIIEQEEMRTKE